MARLVFLNCAPSIDVPLARDLYERYRADYVALCELVNNPRLSLAVVDELISRLVADLRIYVQEYPMTSTEPWEALTSFMRTHPGKIPLEEIHQILLLAGDKARSEYNAHKNGSAKERKEGDAKPKTRPLWDTLGRFAEYIIRDRAPVSADILCVLFPYIEDNPRSVCDFLSHPKVDATVLRHVFPHTENEDVYIAVANESELRHDPQIRAKLLQSSNPDVLTCLARDADPQLAASLLRRLIKERHFDYVIAALQARPAELPIALDPEDLAPLLQSDDPEHRLTALTYLSRLQHPVQEARINASPLAPLPRTR